MAVALPDPASLLPRVLSETKATPTAIAEKLGISPAAVSRHILRGVRVGDRVVKLEAKKVAGVWHSSWEALARFIVATNAPVEPADQAPTPAEPAGYDQALKQLAGHGVDVGRAGGRRRRS